MAAIQQRAYAQKQVGAYIHSKTTSLDHFREKNPADTAATASLSKVRSIIPIYKVQPGCLVTLLQSIMLDVSREPLNCGVQSLVLPQYGR